MSRQASTEQPSASVNNTRLSDELRSMLQTPYEQVYKTSEDGLTYLKPASLMGVPVAKSGEDSPYWQYNWSSLDAYIAGEEGEEDLKRRAVNKLAHDPTNKEALKEKKLRTDNVSKQRKIREVFGGNQRAHPNQLVAKRYLPLTGLCEQEIMYHIGCKMTDLQVLASKGLLAMDPWDFYRWRVGRVLMDRRRGLLPGTKRDGTRGVINSLDSERGSDPLFREAVIYSARLQGRFAAYGPKKKATTQYIQNGKVVRRSPPRSKAAGNHQTRLAVRPRNTSPPSLLPSRSHTDGIDPGFAQRRRAEQEKVRAERSARAAFLTTGYTGVNAYRAKQAQAKSSAQKTDKDSGSATAQDDDDQQRHASKF